MLIYSEEFKQKIRSLRSRGYTYAEISAELNQPVPKGTLSYICQGVVLSKDQQARIAQLNRNHLASIRPKALASNRRILEAKIEGYRTANQNIKPFLADRRAKLIALAMLYLGEGSKWESTRAPTLGSSSPVILRLYISLLQACYNIPMESFRCRVQHRADQDSASLVRYWSGVTGIRPARFYPSYVDKRTIGKATKKAAYRGVCVVSCAGTNIQLELTEIIGIIDEAMSEGH